MENEIINLPASTGTALTLIASGVIVPAVTALLSHKGLPSWAKRLIPIGLSAAAAVLIVILQGGGDLADKLTTWLLIGATLVGIAQMVYSAMPRAWKRLETATDRAVTPQDDSPSPRPSLEDPPE